MCYLRTRGRKEKELSVYKPLKFFNQREARLKALLETFLVFPSTPQPWMRSPSVILGGRRGRGRQIKELTAGPCGCGDAHLLPAKRRARLGGLGSGSSPGPSSHSGSQHRRDGDGFEILRLTFPALEAIQGLCLEVL